MKSIEAVLFKGTRPIMQSYLRGILTFQSYVIIQFLRTLDEFPFQKTAPWSIIPNHLMSVGTSE